MPVDDSWKRILNDRFDPIYVISLPRATDRHEHTREVFRDLRFSFFDAVDKLALDHDALTASGRYDDAAARHFDRRRQLPMSLAQIACAMSHARVYEDIVRHGHRRALIFEDDVVPFEEPLRSLGAVLGALPADWQILYLGYWYRTRLGAAERLKSLAYLGYHYLHLGRWHVRSARYIRNMYARPANEHFLHAGSHKGTHAYAVTREAAAQLLAYQTPVRFNADRLLNYAHLQLGTLKAYSSRTVFFEQVNRLDRDRLVSDVDD
ncbi:MAG: glycosyltransferase family 25 protein [bacterium]